MASSPVALGRKPQSTIAFRKVLDKLVNVYQDRTSSGMQWHYIQPVIQLTFANVGIVGNVGILKTFYR